MSFRSTLLTFASSCLFAQAGFGISGYPIGPELDTTSYGIVDEFSATNCEFATIDFSEVNSGYRGTSSQKMVAQFRLNSGRKILNAGARINYETSGFKKVYNDELGRSETFPLPTTLAETLVAAETFSQDYAKISFQTSIDLYENPSITRSIYNFAYFIDVDLGDNKAYRLWLNRENGSRLFSPEDYSRDNYYYSNGIYLAGYSSAYYLWSNSGSPLFETKFSCS